MEERLEAKYTLEFSEPNGKWDHESKSINLTAEETKRVEGKTQLFVQIKNYGYFFVFTVGDPRQPVVKNTFWPDQWKEGKGIGNGNASLHVEASRMVGGIVEVIDSEPLDSIMIPPHSFKLPKAVASGSVIIFRAKLDENANEFKIRLLHDAPEHHFYLGATVMLIEVDFNNDIVKWMSYDNQKEHNQGKQENNNQFEAGKVFECKMVITQQDDQQKKIQIAVLVNDVKLMDFVGNLPIWTLNWMQTEGGIKLFQEPLFEFANEETKLFKRELEHLLYDGDVLCVKGILNGTLVDGINNFNIYLFHEANELSSEIGDIALQIRYNVGSGTFYLESFLHDTKKKGNSSRYEYSKLTLGQDFHFKIDVVKNKYVIYSSGSEGQEYEDTRIPPWAVNWLVVDGGTEVEFGADDKRCIGAVQKPLPANIRQLYPNNLLVVGNQIVVRGKVEKEAMQIEVSLFREALEWNTIIGQTVLRVQLNASTIIFNSYIVTRVQLGQALNQKEHNQGKQENNNQFEAGKVFECKMVITQQDDQQKKIQIAVLVNDVKLMDFVGNLPIWTLNWMQTEGGIKLFQEPLFEFANEETKLFKRELEHLLYDGDVLCVKGILNGTLVDGINNFNIYLFHEANELSSEIGDIALQIRYNVGSGTFYLESFLHDTKKKGNSSRYEYSKLTLGQDFHFKIDVVKNKYVIYSSGSEGQEYEDTRIPPWAVNWLVVDGGTEVEFGADDKRCIGAVQKPLPANIRQLYPNNLLVVGNQIVVRGKVEKEAMQIEVSLFREALEWNTIIGQTVLRVQLNASTIIFNSYIAKEWTYPEEGNATNSRPIGNKLVEDEQFTLKIYIEGKQKFIIHYDDAEEPLIYEQATLPIWAAQYIVVNGLKTPTSDENKLVKIE